MHDDLSASGHGIKRIEQEVGNDLYNLAFDLAQLKKFCNRKLDGLDLLILA
ncbi:MAG TPA: hypothetical protein VNE63_21545 [Candidatus Acidoferrales bacterium]|nr:hypothetical protein [Candidatus Acidoferrales bacterium]